MNSSFFPVEHLPGVHVAEKHPDKRLGNWERHAGNENRKKGWKCSEMVYVQIYLDTQERARIKRVWKVWWMELHWRRRFANGSLLARFFFEWKWRMKDEKRWERVSFDLETRSSSDLPTMIPRISSFILDYPLKRIPISELYVMIDPITRNYTVH